MARIYRVFLCQVWNLVIANHAEEVKPLTLFDDTIDNLILKVFDDYFKLQEFKLVWLFRLEGNIWKVSNKSLELVQIVLIINRVIKHLLAQVHQHLFPARILAFALFQLLKFLVLHFIDHVLHFVELFEFQNVLIVAFPASLAHTRAEFGDADS